MTYPTKCEPHHATSCRPALLPNAIALFIRPIERGAPAPLAANSAKTFLGRFARPLAPRFLFCLVTSVTSNIWRQRSCNSPRGSLRRFGLANKREVLRLRRPLRKPWAT
jgi:hypothetical protein